jgi:phospholipid transport system substrate-binding protein
MAMAMASLGSVAHAAQTDPAAAQIESLDAQLVDVMKQAKSLSVQARLHKLEPVVAHAYDASTMIRFAVGSSWSSIPAPQQEALTEAFAKLTAASYAHQISGYSGEHFEISPNVLTRGPDKVVATTLVSPHDGPVSISYRMRQSGGTWKIIDVYYNGAISQLTTRHSDFQSTLEHGGAAALIAHLNALVDKQLK